MLGQLIDPEKVVIVYDGWMAPLDLPSPSRKDRQDILLKPCLCVLGAFARVNFFVLKPTRLTRFWVG